MLNFNNTDLSYVSCSFMVGYMSEMKKGSDFESFSAKSDDEHLALRHERHHSYGKRMVDMKDGFESDARSRVSSSNRVERRKVYAGRNENYMSNVDNWDVEVDSFQEKMSYGFARVKIARDFDDSPLYSEDEYSRGLESLGEGRSTFQRVDHEDLRYQREMHGYIDGPSNAGEDDRAQLLRQIDELKDQLSRSGGFIEKDKEKVALDRRMAYQDPRISQNWHPDSHLGTNRVPMQYANKDSQYSRGSYQNQYAEQPYMRRREETSGNGFYPSCYAPDHIQGYDVLRRAPYQSSPIYQQSPSHAYIPAGYVNDEMVYSNNVEPYPHSISGNSNRQVPLTSYDKYYDIQNDKMLAGSFGSQDHNHRVPNPPSLRPSDTPSNRRSSDVKSETCQLQREQLPSSGQLRKSIAGGAPFVACHNCFELLLLPKNSTRKKVRCGACSTVITFSVSNKDSVVSSNLVGANDERPMPSTQGNGLLKQGRIDFASDDYDNSSVDFQSMDGERGDNKFSDMKNRNSASKYSSEMDAMENLIAAIPDPFTDMEKDKAPPPLAGSTLQDYFEYSNKYHRPSRPADGNGSGLSDHSKESSNKAISRRKESAATEIEFSSNEYSNTRSSFGSSMNGDCQMGSSRAPGSYLAGVDEKSPLGSDRYSDENDRANVTVNGHLIANELIKSAEKVAGRIRPGDYWYVFVSYRTCPS